MGWAVVALVTAMKQHKYVANVLNSTYPPYGTNFPYGTTTISLTLNVIFFYVFNNLEFTQIYKMLPFLTLKKTVLRILCVSLL